MRALIQRVTTASIRESLSSHEPMASINRGMLILAGFEKTDTPEVLDQMLMKIKNLRIFSDPQGKMNLAGADVGAEYLIVSQFTLFADMKHGNRPSFIGAAEKDMAISLYMFFVERAKEILGAAHVKNGSFGAMLAVSLVNDGPVTLWLDSQELFGK